MEWPRVHYLLAMEWPRVKVISTKALTEYKFIGGGWLPMLMSFMIFLSIFVPYFIVLGRGTIDPFLPFVSQAAGSPPQSGVFNLFIILASLLAFIGLNLLHMGIRIQKKRIEDPSIRKTASLLNKVSLIPGHAAIVGMVVVSSFPIDFYRTSEEWMEVIIIPHLIGGFSLFIGGIFYCILITYVLSLLHPDRKQLLGIRVFLICLITMCSALQGYTVNDAFMDEFKPENRMQECTVNKSFIRYNMSYLVSSVCEWLMLITFIVFFMTMREEAQDFSLSLTITMKEDDEVKRGTQAKGVKKEDTASSEISEVPSENREEIEK